MPELMVSKKNYLLVFKLNICRCTKNHICIRNLACELLLSSPSSREEAQKAARHLDPAKIFVTSKFSYLLFCNPAHIIETRTANRWELLIANQLDESL